MVKKALQGAWGTCVLLIACAGAAYAAPRHKTPTSTPYTGTAVPLPGKVEAENFDNGGMNVALFDTTAGNSGGAYRSTAVDIEAASEGGYDIGWISAGEWLAYSVNVSAAGSYTLQARVASLGQGGTFHIESNGANLTGALTVPDSGGWQNWMTISKTVQLAAGAQIFKVVFESTGPNGAVGNLNWFSLAAAVPTASPFTGTAIALPGSFPAVNFDNGGEGVAYHDVTADNSGGAYRSTGVDIEAASGGGYDVGWIDDGEWLAYSVNVTVPGAYLVQVQVASPLASGVMHASFAGVNTAATMIPTTGAWQNWTTLGLNATLAAGPQTLKLVFDTGGFNVASVTVVPVPVVTQDPPPPSGDTTTTSGNTTTTSGDTTSTSGDTSTAGTGETILVHAGDDLQGAINRALPGDTLLLDAGATFTGNFVLPAKSGSDYITIRSAASDASLPDGNARITPAYASLLPKLKSPNTLPALATDPGAHHYRLLALEFPANPLGYYDMLDLGDGSSAQSSLSQVPHDLIVDRVYMHGDPTVGQKRAIGLNSASTSILNSYISDIKAEGQDSQAIAGWNGPGPYTIANNYLEAAGENILFGGADPSIVNLVPSNITITGNYVTKQLAWRGQSWQVKNGFELKNAAHVTISGNLIENDWVNAQMGCIVLFTIRDQDGTAPWSTVADVTFANNVVRHAGAFVNVLGYDDEPGGHPSVRMQGLTITGNLVYDIDPQKWGDPVTGEWATGRIFQILNGPKNLTITHNTVLGNSPNVSANLNSAVTIGQVGDTYLTEGLVMSNNVMSEGQYGVIGDTVGIGVIALDTYAPGWVFTDNMLIRGPYGDNYNYPASTVVTPAGATVLDPTTFTVMPAFSTSPTTDGKTIGADLAQLKSTISGLDLTK